MSQHEAAFPRVGQVDAVTFVDVRGMTLRDYFAACALSALMVDPMSEYHTDVRAAYAIADLMLRERVRK
jgi:hypothetical protein